MLKIIKLPFKLDQIAINLPEDCKEVKDVWVKGYTVKGWIAIPTCLLINAIEENKMGNWLHGKFDNKITIRYLTK